MSGRTEASPTDIVRWAMANWTIVFSGLFVQSGLSALTLIILARSVAPVEYGRYLASFALASFAVIVPRFGIDSWLLTQPRASRQAANLLWFSSIRALVLTQAIWAVLMLPISLMLLGDTYPAIVLFPTLFGVAMDSFVQVSFASMRSQDRHFLVTVLQAVASGSLLGLAVLLPLDKFGVGLFAIARSLLSLFFALLVMAILVRELWGHRVALTPVRRLLVASRPFFLAALSSSVYVKADLTIISLALGAAAASVYGPAINVMQATFLPALAVYFLIVPRMSAIYSGHWNSIGKGGSLQIAVQGLIGASTTVVLFLFSSPIINTVFGPGYEASEQILQFLSPVAFLRALNMGTAALIMASGHQYQRTRVQIAAALLNVIGNLIVVGTLGLVGVSGVYIFSELALLVGQLILLKSIRARTSGVSL